MVELKAKLKVRRDAYKVEVKGQLALPFEARRQPLRQARLASGEEVAIKLPPGEILRGGDLVTASDGRVIEVVSIPEKLFHIEGAALPRIAYLLGNGHVPVEFGDAFIRITEVPELEEPLRKLGLQVSTVEAPFEPEVMPAAHGHEHEHHHGHGHGHDHHH